MTVRFPAATAAAAKSLQSSLTLCNLIDVSPPGSPIPGTLQARTLEWVAISLSNAWKWKVKVKSLGHVWLLVTPWTAAHQAPLSIGFSRQEYWSGAIAFSNNRKQYTFTQNFTLSPVVTVIVFFSEKSCHLRNWNENGVWAWYLRLKPTYKLRALEKNSLGLSSPQITSIQINFQTLSYWLGLR